MINATVSEPRFGFTGYPFLFIRVKDRPELGICAVQGYHSNRLLIAPNVKPIHVDAYEIVATDTPLWIGAENVYGAA